MVNYKAQTKHGISIKEFEILGLTVMFKLHLFTVRRKFYGILSLSDADNF